MDAKPYVLIFDELNLGLIGPFETDAAACDAGAAWQEEEGDNPCWQLVHLTDAQATSPLPIRPAPAKAGA